MKNIDILIIGAGISGAILAERYASLGKKVLIIEKKNHIAGNCYDYLDEDGNLVSKYGSHLFYTTEDVVWDYVNQFSDWNPIVVSNNHDDAYLSNLYQALPKEGFTKLFENILDNPNIEVLLDTDYCDIKDQYTNYEKLFYTGPVNRFFEFTHQFSEKLEGRSIHFVSESTDYESFEEKITEVTEVPKFENDNLDKAAFIHGFITKDEVFYAVPSALNQENAELDLVQKATNYNYFNIDEEFKNALDLFHQLEKSNETIYKTAV
ncbi:UDP-galactopyranose mutase [Flavobacterium seoulense]|uniref:UDP-galactopyranose mutase n=1 Tax=Flavobacterium seoulense TaxID=1492738 RepID=A0A066WSB4_9FLAO|nr:UDP-galactopyranose mutase [Flavobacterium seoulense]KDN55473.1 UDP-galactopyranose mutase [Flavobacterium seoulense]